MHDQSPAAGSSYCLAVNRFFVIPTFSHYTVSAITSFLSHIGGNVIVDGAPNFVFLKEKSLTRSRFSNRSEF